MTDHELRRALRHLTPLELVSAYIQAAEFCDMYADRRSVCHYTDDHEDNPIADAVAHAARKAVANVYISNDVWLEAGGMIRNGWAYGDAAELLPPPKDQNV